VKLIGLSEQEYKQNAQTLSKQYPWGVMNDGLIALFTEMQRSLSEVAKLSGGYTDFLEKPKDAEKVYSTIFGAINKRYLIGYYPKPQDNGKRHTVKIEVRGHPEYVVVGRKTYLPQ